MNVDVDLGSLAAVASRLDLREPNREAVESIAFELVRHYRIDRRHPPFEGVVDSATGMGKTYIFAGALEYLAYAEGVRNFALIAPSRTILDKTVEQLTPGHPKSIIGNMNAPLVVVTAENFNTPSMASAMDDDSRVKLFVFTVQSLLKPTTKAGRRTHDFQEGLGGGLYERMQAANDLVVFADEHHAYNGPQFSAAVRELNPWALIGLTATPKGVPDDQIIYRFPLAAAIAGKYVKTPVIVGRRDDKHDPITKLLDGTTLLERKRDLADQWSAANGVSRWTRDTVRSNGASISWTRIPGPAGSGSPQRTRTSAASAFGTEGLERWKATSSPGETTIGHAYPRTEVVSVMPVFHSGVAAGCGR